MVRTSVRLLTRELRTFTLIQSLNWKQLHIEYRATLHVSACNFEERGMTQCYSNTMRYK